MLSNQKQHLYEKCNVFQAAYHLRDPSSEIRGPSLLGIPSVLLRVCKTQTFILYTNFTLPYFTTKKMFLWFHFSHLYLNISSLVILYVFYIFWGKRRDVNIWKCMQDSVWPQNGHCMLLGKIRSLNVPYLNKWANKWGQTPTLLFSPPSVKWENLCLPFSHVSL